MPKATKDDGKPPPKKKSKPGKQSSLLAYKNDPVQLNQVLQSKYEGKRILLTAASLYGRKIPKGEEELLFQYHIGSVNSDNTTATIEYDDRCITEGDHVFQAYPDNTETTIDDYNLSTFQEDHKRYHIHLGREQKIINDAKEASQKEEKEAAAKNLLDMADIDGKMAEEISCYDILVAEFESVGELVDYVVQEGDHAGKVIKKQKWKHTLSGYEFDWPHKYTKAEFNRDKIWKAARAVIKKRSQGWERLQYVLEKNGKPIISTADHDGTKYTREEDMENRVYAVLAAVATKTPFNIFDNNHMKMYLQSLNSKHRPPYGLERNRIVEVMIDYVASEMAKIIDEWRLELGDGFVSVSTDFWTNPHRREQFGALVIDLIARLYYVESHGKYMFMSKQTAERLGVPQKSKLTDMEYVLNFEKFDKPKTIVNVSEWIFESFECAKLKHADVNQFSADGASNAIGSVSEYESLSRTARGNDVQFDVCYAHQNQRSGGYASGTLQFAEPVNTELGAVLGKNHTIQVRLCRSAARMKVYRDIQQANERKPLLNPDPGNETRWDNCIEEAKRANTIMGDACETIEKLLSPDGDDRDMLTAEEASAEDYTRLNYTESDKMILRQFECAAEPAITFSKFTQDRRETFSYVFYESRKTIAQSRRDTFSMYNDVSHMSRTVDLRNRGPKTVLVKRATAVVDDAVAREYSQVIDIDPLIETYRVEYAKDLETRLNLNVTKLPPALAISTLLNPLFGLEATIVGSGLMTEEQYATARNLVIRMLHDIIDKGSVVAVDDSSSELDSSDDEILPPTEDANYTKASNEFSLFEKKVKKKKYLPELIKSASGSLSGEFRGKPKAIWVAPVAKKGKDLFSKKNLADYIDERG
ncbi:hypothetical protein ACHAXN_000889, partial [Cyclotella atomus]